MTDKLPVLEDVWFDLTDGLYFKAPVGVIPMRANTSEGIDYFYWLIPTIKNNKLTYVIFINKENNDKKFFESCQEKLVEYSMIRVLEFLSGNKDYVYRSAKIYKDIENFNQIFEDTNREEFCRFTIELEEESQSKFINFIEYISRK